MPESPFALLTRKERDCLRASLGRTNDEIARELGISPNTVKTHLASARRKLGSIPRGQAARALIAWEGEGDHPFPASSNEVMFETPVTAAPPARGGTPVPIGQWLPLRTGDRNDLRPAARLLWIFVLAVLGAIGFGAFASGVNLVSSLFR